MRFDVLEPPTAASGEGTTEVSGPQPSTAASGEGTMEVSGPQPSPQQPVGRVPRK